MNFTKFGAPWQGTNIMVKKDKATKGKVKPKSNLSFYIKDFTPTQTSISPTPGFLTRFKGLRDVWKPSKSGENHDILEGGLKLQVGRDCQDEILQNYSTKNAPENQWLEDELSL